MFNDYINGEFRLGLLLRVRKILIGWYFCYLGVGMIEMIAGKIGEKRR